MTSVCILNGTDKPFDQFEADLEDVLQSTNDNVKVNVFTLRNMDIDYCIGCWDCWVKTPGVCKIQDEQPKVLESLINADHLFLVSNIRTGFVTSVLKRTIDKMIPIIHPYIRIYHGELHHNPRYKHYPKLHILLVGEDKKNETVTSLLKNYFYRVSLNFNTTVETFNYYTDKGDVANVLSHL